MPEATYSHCNRYNDVMARRAKPAKVAYKTIPLRPDTWERLRDYKMGGATYDDVLNELMDALPMDRITAKALRVHDERMRTFKGRDWREIRKDVRGRTRS